MMKPSFELDPIKIEEEKRTTSSSKNFYNSVIETSRNLIEPKPQTTMLHTFKNTVLKKQIMIRNKFE